MLAYHGYVGWHWLKYLGDDDRDPKAEISNKGILNANYKPYAPLLDQMREINEQVYRLKFKD